jgi:protein phosphatase-4 regulatory subunit 3
MALVAPPAHDRKRVKVYELKNNDWFDRGTGFCKGVVVNVGQSQFVPSTRLTRAAAGRRQDRRRL